MNSPANWRTPVLVLVCGAIILTLIAANLQLLSLGTAALQISYGLILLGTVYIAGLRLSRR